MTACVISPGSAADVADVIADAARGGRRLEIRGGGSKAEIGAPRDAAILDMRGMSGVVDYDPAELVLTVRAGTPLDQIEALVASEGQMLAFEPFDHGPLFGRSAGAATIGGVVGAAVSGSRRLSAGATRDHLLGFAAVSGKGEIFKAGAKVVKNVTGYDLPKLAAGSWGRLFALTEVTLKVLPRPRESVTLALEGLTPRQGQAALARAMGSGADVQAAAHAVIGGRALTAVRLEGFGPSIAARTTILAELWRDHRPVLQFEPLEGGQFWTDLAALTPLDRAQPLWRISTRPSRGPEVAEGLQPLGASWLFDWAGGLTWASCGGDPALARAAAEAADGHATLIRAPADLRRRVPALQPLAPAVMALQARVRAAFDPDQVFETGRFLDVADAD